MLFLPHVEGGITDPEIINHGITCSVVPQPNEPLVSPISNVTLWVNNHAFPLFTVTTLSYIFVFAKDISYNIGDEV